MARAEARPEGVFLGGLTIAVWGTPVAPGGASGSAASVPPTASDSVPAHFVTRQSQGRAAPTRLQVWSGFLERVIEPMERATPDSRRAAGAALPCNQLPSPPVQTNISWVSPGHADARAAARRSRPCCRRQLHPGRPGRRPCGPHGRRRRGSAPRSSSAGPCSREDCACGRSALRRRPYAWLVGVGGPSARTGSAADGPAAAGTTASEAAVRPATRARRARGAGSEPRPGCRRGRPRVCTGIGGRPSTGVSARWTTAGPGDRRDHRTCRSLGGSWRARRRSRSRYLASTSEGESLAMRRYWRSAYACTRARSHARVRRAGSPRRGLPIARALSRYGSRVSSGQVRHCIVHVSGTFGGNRPDMPEATPPLLPSRPDWNTWMASLEMCLDTRTPRPTRQRCG